MPADQSGDGFKPRPNPLVVPGSKDREAAIARLEGMEDVLVSGVHLNAEQSRITIHDLPDLPGNCSRVFNAVATGGILVDMIVQNLTAPGKAELSFTVPRADLTRALKRTQDVVREIDGVCRVVGDADVAVLFVLGVGMRTHTGVARTMFGALAVARHQHRHDQHERSLRGRCRREVTRRGGIKRLKGSVQAHLAHALNGMFAREHSSHRFGKWEK